MVTQDDLEYYTHRVYLALEQEYIKRHYPLYYIPVVVWKKAQSLRKYYRITLHLPGQTIFHSYVCRYTGNLYKAKGKDNRIVPNPIGNIYDKHCPKLFKEFSNYKNKTTVRKCRTQLNTIVMT